MGKLKNVKLIAEITDIEDSNKKIEDQNNQL